MFATCGYQRHFQEIGLLTIHLRDRLFWTAAMEAL